MEKKIERTEEKRMTLGEAMALAIAGEKELQENIEYISELSNDEIVELLGMVQFGSGSSFNDHRFVNKLIMESLRRILNEHTKTMIPPLFSEEGKDTRGTIEEVE